MHAMLNRERIMNILLRILCIPLLLMLFTLVSRSELPPRVYENWQEKSAEKVEFFVKEISSRYEQDKKISDISATVTISKVYRTELGLTEGHELTVEYTITKGILGPSSPLFLQTGNTYIAYLTTRDGRYVPSAGGASFIAVNTFREDHFNLP